MAKIESDIRDSLAQLGYGSGVDLSNLLEGGPKSPPYTQLIANLSSELKCFYKLEEQVHAISTSDDSTSFSVELGSFLKEYGCPYASLVEGSPSQRLRSREQRLQLLDYLCTEVQSARMLAQKPSRSPQSSQPASALRTILTDLGSPSPSGLTSSQLFSLIESRIRDHLQRIPPNHLGHSLLPPLTANQWSTLERINTDLRAESILRAETLLKRLDVTIQSFTWSERVKRKENEVVQAFRPRREELRARSEISMLELLASRDDLARVEKSSGSRVRKGTKCSINKLLMGKVPDRGGRLMDTDRPAPEMPQWQKRTPGGGGGQQRGRGGGRVQGGWARGRGGRGGY